MDAHLLLTYIWAALIAFAVFGYLVMDGFDLGIGILSPLFDAEHARPVLMNSIAPIWDGNETWLARRFWDAGFFVGSVLAAVMQGVALGAILQGIHVIARHYAGGWWDWLSPFSVLTGAALVAGYAALGATWLIWKTEGALRRRAMAFARRSLGALIVGMTAVSAVTPYLHYRYYQRWFAWPTVLATAQVPLLVAIVAGLLFFALKRGWQRAPFLLTLALFALSYLGLAISVYPYLVPQSITFMAAAAPLSTQLFLLAGSAILLPIIIAYTSYAYWVFRGKVGTEGYH